MTQRRTPRSAIAMVGLLATLAGAPAPAYAWGSDWVSIVIEWGKFGASVSYSFYSSFQALASTLYLTVTSAASEIRVEQNKQMGVAREVAQGRVNWRTELYTRSQLDEESAAHRTDEYAVSLYSVANMTTADQSYETYKKALSSYGFEDTSFHDRGLSGESRAATTAGLLDIHAKKYCTGVEADRGRCTSAPAEQRNRDVSASALEVPVDNAKLTFTADNIKDARRFSTLVVNAVPNNYRADVASEATPAGRAKIFAEMKTAAELSLARDAFNGAIALRSGKDQF